MRQSEQEKLRSIVEEIERAVRRLDAIDTQIALRVEENTEMSHLKTVVGPVCAAAIVSHVETPCPWNWVNVSKSPPCWFGRTTLCGLPNMKIERKTPCMFNVSICRKSCLLKGCTCTHTGTAAANVGATLPEGSGVPGPVEAKNCAALSGFIEVIAPRTVPCKFIYQPSFSLMNL